MNRLREFRVRAGLSQIELSEMTGVAQATISDLERGNRVPSPLVQGKLARALGGQVEDLFPHEQRAGTDETSRIGDRLRQLRIARGWTQTELASRSGTLQAIISKIESGDRIPNAETRARLAQALGISPAEAFPAHQDGGYHAGSDPVPLAQVSNNLRHYRVRSGLTQAQLARESGLRQEVISKIENGRQGLREGVTYDTAARLARCLGVEPREVFPDGIAGNSSAHFVDGNNRLAAERRSRGKSIEELARDSGLSVSVLRRLESGQRVPDPPIRKLLALLLQVNEEELFPTPPSVEPLASVQAPAWADPEDEGARLLRELFGTKPPE